MGRRNRQPTRWRWFGLLAALLPVVLILLLCCAEAFARAGGGGGYSGGRSGGGGGRSGGGGGDGAVFEILFWLVFRYPQVGVPVLIGVVAFVIYTKHAGTREYESGVIRRGSMVMDLNLREAMLGPLREADPAFDERAFAARVTLAFHKIQSAWADQQLAPVRPFISDGVHERFSLQFDEQRFLGYRNAMEDVVVHDVHIAQVQSDHLFDQVSVHVSASARDFKVSLRDGKVLTGSDDSGDFAEVWSFLRRRGVLTAAADKPGLIEGNCPNCGAGLEMNQNANCQHCGALLRSGQYDWVLAEITQESEWVAGRRTDLPSVARLVARDPNFNLQDLEDRASVMFWRRAAAERLGKVDPLRKIASATFSESYARQLRPRDDGTREYFGECAVGSVDTLGAILNAAGEWDYALVEVRWSGTAFHVSRDNKVRRTDDATLSRTVFELARRSSARSDAGHAISSAHCPSCGAPEAGGAGGACPFCGTVLNDGTRDWVLTAVRLPAEARRMLHEAVQEEEATRAAARVAAGEGARWSPSAAAAGTPGADSLGPLAVELPAAARPATSTAGLLAWMIHMALSDGQLDRREHDMLSRVAAKRAVPRARLEAMIAAARHEHVDLPQPADARQSREWIRAMASAALADGKLSKDEYHLLLSTGRRAGLAEYDVRALVRKLRADTFAVAKEALRNNDMGSGRPR